jgi:hypothetical protein
VKGTSGVQRGRRGDRVLDGGDGWEWVTDAGRRMVAGQPARR